MLQKCANPTCAVPFLLLREGKLFLAEPYPSNPAAFDENRRKERRREHFWLCSACATDFTLRFDSTQGIRDDDRPAQRAIEAELPHARCGERLLASWVS
jgi:hypothetical protein